MSIPTMAKITYTFIIYIIHWIIDLQVCYCLKGEWRTEKKITKNYVFKRSCLLFIYKFEIPVSYYIQMKLTLVNVCIQHWFFNLIYCLFVCFFLPFLTCKFLAMIHNSCNYIKTTIFQHVFGILKEWEPFFIYFFARCIHNSLL